MSEYSLLLYLAAYIAIIVGFVGSVLPVLPGPPLIWLGMLLWAWGNQFDKIGWPTLTILAILALISMGLNFFLTTTLSRRAGVSWRAIGGAVMGALVGGLVLSAVPILGTFFGAVIGAVIGMWLVEYIVRGDTRLASKAVRAYLSGATLSAIAQFIIACMMLTIFVWQVYIG